MPNTFPYNASDYEPPAPELQLIVSVPGSGGISSRQQEVTGLCDTGADLTCIPRYLVEKLGLFEVDEVEIAPYDGPSEVRPLYAVRLRIIRRQFHIARVVAVDSDKAIIGRDLLNSLRLELDGAAQTLVVH